MFAKMTACWQRVVCLSSPDAKFWEIVDSDRYGQARNQLAQLARAHGITFIDSTPLLTELRPYRRPGDPWHFAGARYEDYGLASKWQPIVFLSRAICGIRRQGQVGQ